MTTKERVASILRFSRQARNSDRELLIIYLQKSGMEMTDKQMEIFRGLNMESIRRSRQELQAAGEYSADQKIQKSRQQKATQIAYAKRDTRAEILDTVKEIGW